MLFKLIGKHGGFYRTNVNKESVMFPLYNVLKFEPLTLDRRGVSCGVVIDAPPFQGARSERARERSNAWENSSKQRLSQGALVVLLWSTPTEETRLYLGVITSSTRDLAASAADNKEALHLTVKISFFDPEAETRILAEVKQGSHPRSHEKRILTECPIMFESIRPFLEVLQGEPTLVPFQRYLAHSETGSLQDAMPAPPRYSTGPVFEFELGHLFHPDSGVEVLKLRASSPASIQAARAALKAAHPTNPLIRASVLDESQADALVDALTREVALIQG